MLDDDYDDIYGDGVQPYDSISQQSDSSSNLSGVESVASTMKSTRQTHIRAENTEEFLTLINKQNNVKHSDS